MQIGAYVAVSIRSMNKQ